jgi:hypothetical protein
MPSMLDAQRSTIGSLAKLGEGIRANSDAKTQAGLGRGAGQNKKLVNVAWTNTFPAQGATLDLDFANDRGFVRGIGQGRSMDAVTFTRATIGTFVNSLGLFEDGAINQPRFDWSSTARTGAGTIANPFVIPLLANSTSNGLLIEESRTNRILWCRDATQTDWVKLNVTAAKDQVGVDGVASSASSLTATLANGTCIQTITLASGSRTGSVYLKRITGTGDIQVSLDGTTYTTVDLSNGLWNRIAISATVLNPVVGIRIVTSGDAVAMDFGQVEDGANVTSPILTTTASVIRATEVTQILQPILRLMFKADITNSATEISGTFLADITRGNYASSTTSYEYLTLNSGGGATSYTLILNRADNGGTNQPVGLSLTAYEPKKISIAFDVRKTQEESAIDGVVTTDKTLSRNAASSYDRLAILNSGRTSPTIVAQGYITRLIYFPQVITANGLAALTE